MRSAASCIAGVFAAMLVAGCGHSIAPSADLAPIANCPASAATEHGFGAGPAYLSGQSAWYAGGQAAFLAVDSKYSGPVQVRASEFGGDGTLQITLAGLDPTSFASAAAKESQHGVMLVSAVETSQGTLELPAVPSSSLWRGWLGTLSTDGPGCFALQVDGTGFSETIVFPVHAGAAPPG